MIIYNLKYFKWKIKEFTSANFQTITDPMSSIRVIIRIEEDNRVQLIEETIQIIIILIIGLIKVSIHFLFMKVYKFIGTPQQQQTPYMTKNYQTQSDRYERKDQRNYLSQKDYSRD